MDSQQQGTLADARETLRTGRDANALQYRELIASRDAIDRERLKYFELFEFAPDACFLTDSNGVIREANAAASELLGVPAQFLAGTMLPSFFEQSARKSYRHRVDELFGSERSDNWEIRVQSRNGTSTDVSVSIGRTASRDKSLAGYSWVVRDIAKRKQAENELLRRERQAREEAEVSNRVKSDFLALLSHEFRTPLQAIFGYTELLEREIHGPLNDSQRRYLERIQQSQQHLLGLITTILDFAKLDSGQSIEAAIYPTVISEVLVHMEGLVGAQLEDKELTYTYSCGNSSLVASADAARVQQILLNLLANAIKFTERGGAITLECEQEPETVAIRVIDNGKGIPPDKLDEIFQPFVQLKPRGAVTSGTGLGLSISRRLAMAMGGSLDVASELGKGATFTLRLQRAVTAG